MASPFAGLDAHGHTYALLEAQLAHFMQSSSAEVGHPSPNDLSAAAILATLADSRPPTSQGLEGEELMDDHHHDHYDNHHDGGGDDDDDDDTDGDDDEQGGILLAGEDMTTASLAHFAHVSDAFHSSANYVYYEMDPSPYDALDQHAAALESLSMEPLHAVSSTTPASIPDNQHEQDFEVGMHDELLIVRNKYTFMDISNFFQRLAFDKLWLSDLNDVRLPPAITRHDLQGDRCDFQGIDWNSRHCTRAEVRKARETFERARMQPKLRDICPRYAQTPDTENFFAFRRMNTTHRPYIPHFQLRNLLATTSRNDIYYPSRNQVLRTDSSGSPATTIMDLTKRVTDGQRFQVTTLAASDHVLIAGGFEGEYALTSLLSTYGTPLTLGRIRDRSAASKSHITNHIHIFDSRNNYTPQAVLCSNDYRLRILDCETNTFTHSFLFPAAVNCSATSPDGRMRVVVGDFQETLITNAETGQPFESLNSHTDDAFACAWADDGIHVATAAQDSTVVVWDARYWGKPLTVLHSELSIPRVLRFSPVGGGPRVLVAAEADDYVSIINAQTFETRQVFDFFGSAAGISLTPDGQSLFIANAEKSFGGIMELERAGWCERRPSSRWSRPLHHVHDDAMDDWMDDDALRCNHRVVSNWAERDRRRLSLADIHV